ncbi:MAG TPA: FxsA family protein [Kiloniellaceae bacterium]|nr:FxsA family protein [Kiloniellaceae bacterium]HIP76990.1 FxsA family protein [Kiloniellaceae bacterium]
MALVLLAVFIGLPLLEIAVFIEVGSAFGVWPTIAATVATAIAGSLLLRAQGLATLLRARAQMDQGQLPAREMFEGICLVLAGALLLVPGFVTDALGLLLFVPPFREVLRRFIGHRLAARGGQGRTRIFVDGQEVNPNSWEGGGPARPDDDRRSTVIDGDFEEVDDLDRPYRPGRRRGTDPDRPQDSPEDRRNDGPRRLEP